MKNSLQKEERYRNEIKDLRHTNRQLLKHLHYLTTGEKDTMDSDDQLSDKSISSPPLTANSDIISVEPSSHPSQNNNNNNNNNNEHDNDMICTTPISSPSPSLITSPVTKDQPHSPSIKHTTTNPISNNVTTTTTTSPSHHSMMPLNHSVQTYQQQQPSLFHDQKLLPNQLIQQQQQESFASSIQIKPLTTFSSEVWHQPTTTYWPPHTTPTATSTTFNQVSSSLPYQDSTLPPHSSMGFMNPNLVSTDMKSVHCQGKNKNKKREKKKSIINL